MSLFEKLEQLSLQVSEIKKDLFEQYNVKRGLRNQDGSGVLVGLTNVGNVEGYSKEGDKITPMEGQLYYRGINLFDLCNGFQSDKRYGFEETVYLLLAGQLPAKEELSEFTDYLATLRDLPQNFTKDIILSLRGKDMMNMLARAVLVLYTVDENSEDYSHINLMKQSLNLIAKFPVITAYSYFAYRHSYMRKPLILRHPEPELGTAENLLYMLKGDAYTQLEAEVLDLCLVLHAEHGGGNNSSFTTRVVSSSGTDTYSAIAAALGSLKGSLHGGANIKVYDMMSDIKKHVKDWTSRDEVSAYLLKILQGKAFDKSGKIYGMGHAIYTLSDPRAIILKNKARDLAEEKGKLDEYNLYELIEELAPGVFATFKGGPVKVIAPNVDFYSGFVYKCLDIPKEIYTPLFAISRIAGWCAHRIEEVTFSSRRIIRPAYKAISPKIDYKPLFLRK